jgi:hypothetical protein
MWKERDSTGVFFVFKNGKGRKEGAGGAEREGEEDLPL